MTANQMIPAVGMLVTVRFESIDVNCAVQDVKQSYGKTRLLIEPVNGDGSQWIEVNRVVRIQGQPVDAELMRMESGRRI